MGRVSALSMTCTSVISSRGPAFTAAQHEQVLESARQIAHHWLARQLDRAAEPAQRDGTLPDPDTCKIIPMPEFQRGFSAAYLNPAPPLDPHAESMYAVSPPPRDWDTRKVESYLAEE